MAESALSDVNVLDLTHYIAGPYCTKLLADYGAQVIKVERPDGGDPARRLGPFFHDELDLEKSGPFLHLNTNKKSITLNLKTTTGRGMLKELVRGADILVESFAPGVMARLGLSYQELEQVNPRLVMVSLSNFGQWGPYRDYQLTEIIAFAMGGDMSITGFQEREPIKLGLTVILFQMGSVAAVAALGAFFGSRYQGIGQHVEVAIMEAEMGTIDRGAPNLAAIAYSGMPTFQRTPVGGAARHILPSGVYPCADGYVFLNAMNTTWWPNFCRMIGRPDLPEAPRFRDPESLYNLDLKEELDTLLLEWALSRTKQQVMEESQAAGYAGAAINTVDDLFRDPHFRERGFFVEVDHPVVGTLTYPGAPFKMGETPWRAGRAPLLGEHNQEIYVGRLGYSQEDLVRLRQLGIV